MVQIKKMLYFTNAMVYNVSDECERVLSAIE